MPATNIGLRPCPILQRVTHGPAAGHLTTFWTAFPWRSAMQQTRHCCKTYHQEWSRSPQGKGGPAVTTCPEWEWTPTHPPEMCSCLFFCTNLSPPPKEPWMGQKWTLRQPPNDLQLWDKWGCTEPVCSFIPPLLLLVKGMSVYFQNITSFVNSALSEVAYGYTSFYSSPFHTNRFGH